MQDLGIREAGDKYNREQNLGGLCRSWSAVVVLNRCPEDGKYSKVTRERGNACRNSHWPPDWQGQVLPEQVLQHPEVRFSEARPAALDSQLQRPHEGRGGARMQTKVSPEQHPVSGDASLHAVQ